MLRYPAVAGQFYEEDKESLTMQIEDSFMGAKGVGYLPTEKSKQVHIENIIGAISPHAGYYFSGQAASFVYEKISKCDIDTFIILGVNHYGLDSNFSTTRNLSWETPLGITAVDRNFITKLMELNKNVKDEPNAHSHEHSIEVQLPFLQFVMQVKNDADKHNASSFNFIPIMIKSPTLEQIKQLAQDIYDTAKKLNQKICIIASSDFTHYGKNYDYTPFHFAKNEKEEVKKHDFEFIDLIKKLDAETFFEKSKSSSICGRLPITVLLFYAKLCNPAQIKLETYYTSDDIMPSKERDDKTSRNYNAVSYASIVIE